MVDNITKINKAQTTVWNALSCSEFSVRRIVRWRHNICVYHRLPLMCLEDKYVRQLLTL